MQSCDSDTRIVALHFKSRPLRCLSIKCFYFDELTSRGSLQSDSPVSFTASSSHMVLSFKLISESAVKHLPQFKEQMGEHLSPK